MRTVLGWSVLAAISLTGCSGGGGDSPDAGTPDAAQQVSTTLASRSGPTLDPRATGVLSDGHGLVAWTEHRDGASWVQVVRRLPGGGMAAVGELGAGVLLGVGFGFDSAWVVWVGSPAAPGRGYPLRVAEFRAGAFGGVETLAELDARPGAAVLVEGRRWGSWALALQGVGPGPAARLFERGTGGVWESRGSLGTLYEPTRPVDTAVAFSEARLVAVDDGYVVAVDVRDARPRVLAGHWAFGGPVESLRPFDGEASAVVGLAAANGAAMLVGRVRASVRARRFVDGGWEPAEFVALADRAALTGWDDDVGRPAGFALLACQRRGSEWDVDLLERPARAAAGWAVRARLADLDANAAEPELIATAEGVVAKWYDGNSPKVTVLDGSGIAVWHAGTPIQGARLVRAGSADPRVDWAVASTVDYSAAPTGVSVRLTVGRGREVLDEWHVPAEVRQADYWLAALATTPEGVLLMSRGETRPGSRLEVDEWSFGPRRGNAVIRSDQGVVPPGPPEPVTAFALAYDAAADTVTLRWADPGNRTPRLLRRRLGGDAWSASEVLSRTSAPIWLLREASRDGGAEGFVVGQGGALDWYPVATGQRVPIGSLGRSGVARADLAIRGAELATVYVGLSFAGGVQTSLRRLDGAALRFDVNPQIPPGEEGAFGLRVGLGGVGTTGLLFGDASQVVVQRYDPSGGYVGETAYLPEPTETIHDAALVGVADDGFGFAVHVDDRIELHAPPGLVDAVGPASALRPAAPLLLESDDGVRMVWFDGPLLRTVLSTPQRSVADLLSDPASVARAPRLAVEPGTRIAWIEDLPAGGSRLVARALEDGIFAAPVEWLRQARRIESFSTRRLADGRRLVVWMEDGQLWSRALEAD